MPTISSDYKLVLTAHKPAGTQIKINREESLGGPTFVTMAGPCTVEDEKQMDEVARAVKRGGASVLRGGAFKPRSSPYSFQGLGKPGLQMLRAAADRYDLRVVTEIVSENQIDLIERYADILQVGARNMQNYELLKALGRATKPVLLKRGIAATIDEWLSAAEYILAGGNEQVILCERGIRTFATHSRFTLDLAAIPIVKKLSHLPVVVDPSHAAGNNNLVIPLALAAVMAGADGLLVEVHDNPSTAYCDAEQALTPMQFLELSSRMRDIACGTGRVIY